MGGKIPGLVRTSLVAEEKLQAFFQVQGPGLRKGSKEWKVKEQARQEWHGRSLQSIPVIAEEP